MSGKKYGSVGPSPDWLEAGLVPSQSERGFVTLATQIWVWVNTYRYIFSGMNIHKSQLFWGSPGVPRFWPIPIYRVYLDTQRIDDLPHPPGVWGNGLKGKLVFEPLCVRHKSRNLGFSWNSFPSNKFYFVVLQDKQPRSGWRETGIDSTVQPIQRPNRMDFYLWWYPRHSLDMGPLADCAAGGDTTPGNPRIEWRFIAGKTFHCHV